MKQRECRHVLPEVHLPGGRSGSSWRQTQGPLTAAKFQELIGSGFRGHHCQQACFCYPALGLSPGTLRGTMKDSQPTLLSTITEQCRLEQNNTEQSGMVRNSMRGMEKQMNVGCGEEGRLGKEKGNKYHQTQGIQIHFSKVGSSWVKARIKT